jgi:hypothetical protein
MKVGDYLRSMNSSVSCTGLGGIAKRLTSTAPSTSAFPLAEVPETPSTTAALISSAYFVKLSPSISLMNVSEEVVNKAERSLFSSVVCFFKEESSAPLGPAIRNSRKYELQCSTELRLHPTNYMRHLPRTSNSCL